MDMDLGFTRLIVDECRHQGALRNQAAYILATAYWETARTMRPIEERGGIEYLKSKPYYPWHGRGFVQLTWEKNYERAGRELGQDFTGDPSAVMEPEHAVAILVTGCLEGWFTGKKLGDYITLQRSDFRNARRVVNGTDRADEIAALARKYDAELLAMGYGVTPPPQSKEKTMIPIGLGGLVARYVLVAAAGAFASHIGWMSYNEAANTLTIDLNSLNIDALLGAGVTAGGAVWWRKIAKAAGGKL